MNVVWPFDRTLVTRSLADADPQLGALIARIGDFTLEPKETHSTFEALARSIVYQQLSGKAASTIWNRLVTAHVAAADGDRAEKEVLSADGLLALSDTELRLVGLSGGKQRALRDLAERWQGGQVPTFSDLRTMDDEAIVASLTRVRGIGRWSVEMLLIFRMARPDVFPVTDLGIRKGFQKTFGMKALPAERTLRRRGERWRPYRSVASWYLWRSLDAPVVI